ncbi:retrovirus-related pol polyprotein from transposon TNT 1-94 [Tanacetum coccineum]
MNSWVHVPVTTPPESGTSTTTKMIVPATIEEKTCKKNDVKARSLLLMALPNEHQLTFDQYVDAQSMFAAIKARFGGNEATKKTQKALLQKLASRLVILGASSTNNINTVNPEVSTATTKVNTASTEIFHEDLEQLHDDDLEEIDLKWNMALLSMRERKFYQRTRKKIIIDGSNTVGYDKSKVECFNCHKMGHFSRECRAPRSKDNRNWNQGSSTKTVKIKDASEKAMRAIDGTGFYWSDMAEEEIQANMALMAFLDSEYDDLLVKLSDTGFKAATYKRGLATLEDQIVKYIEHEVLFSKEIALLKRSVGCKEYELGLLRTELEKVKQEKKGVDFMIAKFNKSAKDLNEMLESQITDKSKKGVGFNAVSSAHHLILNIPTTLDLSYSGLEEFKEPEVNEYGPKDSSLKPTTGCDKESDNSKENIDDSLEQHQMTDTKTSSFESPLKLARLQQNGVAERKNRTLIEAARTMLADSKLPTTFWAEVVSTACYVQNRVLIVKPHNKTPYELFRGFKPAIGFMKPFGCHVTILNTLDNLGKFDGKSDEGFFVGYSLSSKAFRVYNTRTRKVQENLHIGFLENKPMIEGNGPKWLFDIDSLTQSMNYVPVVAGTFSNDFAGTQRVSDSSTSSQQDQDNQDCIVMPIWKDASYFGDAAPRSVADAQIQDKDGF